MTTTNDLDLPTLDTVQPESVDELALIIRDAAETQTPIYPVGRRNEHRLRITGQPARPSRATEQAFPRY